MSEDWRAWAKEQAAEAPPLPAGALLALKPLKAALAARSAS